MKAAWETEYDAVMGQIAEIDAKLDAFVLAPGFVTRNCMFYTRLDNQRNDLQKKAAKIMAAAKQHPPQPNTLWWIDRMWAKNPALVAAMEAAGV